MSDVDETPLATKTELAKRLKSKRKDAASFYEKCRKRAKAGAVLTSTWTLDMLENSERVRVLDEAIEATESDKTTTATIREYALRRVLVLAQSRNAERAELAAWALVVDLTNRGYII